MTGHLYEMRRTPTVRAIQFKNNFYEVKSFLKYSGYEVTIYNHTPFEINVGSLIVEESDYIVLFDDGIKIMNEMDFGDEYKLIY